MSDTKHTPTPWMAVEHSWSTTGIYAKDQSEGGTIAVLCIEGEAAEDTQEELEAWMAANAAFIVRAVNSHEQLVAALNKIHNWLVCAPIATPEDMAQSFAEMERAASIALAAAEA
jgi:hypothetical protein